MRWSNLQAYATLVRPETIFAWYRKVVALKYTAIVAVHRLSEAIKA